MHRKRENFGVLNAEDVKNAPLVLLEGGVENRCHEEYDYRNDLRPDYQGYLFQYTLAGKGYFERNGVCKEVTTGQGFLIHFPEKSRYFLAQEEEAGWEFIYLHFEGEAAAYFMEKIETVNGGCFSLPEDSRAVQMALQLHEKLMAGKQLRKYEGSEFLYRFLCALLWEIEHPEKLEKNDPVAEALRIMQEEYAEIESMEALATRVGISAEHFSRRFSQKMNISPLRYLTNIRLEAAMRDLLNTDLPLEAIARKNGFSSSNYFCRIFRKYVKETPAEYRRRA